MKTTGMLWNNRTGAILENPIPLAVFLGWLSDDDDDKPREEKCDFDPL